MYVWRIHLDWEAGRQTRRIQTRHAETQPNPSPSARHIPLPLGPDRESSVCEIAGTKSPFTSASPPHVATGRTVAEGCAVVMASCLVGGKN